MSINCPEDNFNQLSDAISRVEQHIGLTTNTDTSTVNGRLYNITSDKALQDGNIQKIETLMWMGL